MFTLFRCVTLIGLIFYFSPARDLGGHEHHNRSQERRPAAVAHPPAPGEALEGLWSRLVGSVKEEVVATVVDETATAAGARLKSGAARLMAEGPAVPAPPERPRSSGEDWTLRASNDPSVRCVYRCDGTE